jgi:3-hydroxyacyl-[acyl-carrier-protein] dehydratase
MRWFWIDRVTHLEKGKRARAVKNVTLAEEHLHDHFPGYPVMPQSLMIEGMAQTGGILAGSTVDFKENIVLAKVSKATFYRQVHPGDQMIFEAELVESRSEGHRTETRITVDGELVAESSMMFVNLPMGGGRGVFVFTEALMQLLRECPGFEASAVKAGGRDA